MNKELSEFARSTLKMGLSKCTLDEVLIFKRMYSHKDLLKSADDVVEGIPDDDLDFAMQQVSRTVSKNEC